MHSPKYTVKVVINLNSKRESEKCQSVYLYRKWAQNLDGLTSHSKAGKKSLYANINITSVFDLKDWLVDIFLWYCTGNPKPSVLHGRSLKAFSSTRVSTECSVSESCLKQSSCKPPNQKTLKYCALLFRENKFKPFQFAWSLFSWVLNFILLSLKRSISRESKLISASQL